MRKIKVSKIKSRELFEHLEFIVKNSTPYQRYRGLEQVWDLWYMRRKTLPKKIIELQNKFREGKI